MGRVFSRQAIDSYLLVIKSISSNERTERSRVGRYRVGRFGVGRRRRNIDSFSEDLLVVSFGYSPHHTSPPRLLRVFFLLLLLLQNVFCLLFASEKRHLLERR